MRHLDQRTGRTGAAKSVDHAFFGAPPDSVPPSRSLATIRLAPGSWGANVHREPLRFTVVSAKKVSMNKSGGLILRMDIPISSA